MKIAEKADLDNFNFAAALAMRNRLDHGARKFGALSWRTGTYTDSDNAERLRRAVDHLIAARANTDDPDSPRVSGCGRDAPDFYGLLAKAGIDRLPFKNLRTTFASRLAEAGVSDIVIARLMGHARTSTTRKHYIADRPEDAIEAIGRLVS